MVCRVLLVLRDAYAFTAYGPGRASIGWGWFVGSRWWGDSPLHTVERMYTISQRARGPQRTGTAVEVRVHRLHPGQRTIADHPARFRVVMCGRRFGKSALGIRLACDAALAGQPVGWFAPSYKLALEAWREVCDRLKDVTQRVSEQDKRLELITGGVVEVWTLDTPDPARGRKYGLVVIDEAGIAPNLTEIWQAAIRPTLVDLGGRALILGTPKGRRHGFVKMFDRGMTDDTDWQSFRASTLDNPYIPAEEVAAAKKELPSEIFRQEFEGIPTDDGANPFGLEAVQAAIGELSIHPPVVFGVDLARSMDYTVVCGMDAWRRVAVLERFQMPWAATKTRIQELVKAIPIVADATGVGDAIVEDLQVMGVSVYPHIFTQRSKLSLMQRLIAGFQGKQVTIPEGWLANELQTFEFHYTPTGVRYEAPRGEHDDGVMALSLALYGWDRVQCVPPDGTLDLAVKGDDPLMAFAGTQLISPIHSFAAPEAQLPVSW